MRAVCSRPLPEVAGPERRAMEDRPPAPIYISPAGVAVDGSGNVYETDSITGLIRKITPDGIISTVAGNALGGFSGDGGPALRAALSRPSAIKVDANGNIYVADAGNNRVRKIAPNGVITTIAGGGSVLGDGGPATSALLKLEEKPNAGGGLAFDAGGNLYIADTCNHRIRKVSPAGVITTVAGNGQPGISGDNGPAISASLNVPLGIAVDTAGSLFIADQQNNRIRKVTNGTITTVAGTGGARSLAMAASQCRPHSGSPAMSRWMPPEISSSTINTTTVSA